MKKSSDKADEDEGFVSALLEQWDIYQFPFPWVNTAVMEKSLTRELETQFSSKQLQQLLKTRIPLSYHQNRSISALDQQKHKARKFHEFIQTYLPVVHPLVFAATRYDRAPKTSCLSSYQQVALSPEARHFLTAAALSPDASSDDEISSLIQQNLTQLITVENTHASTYARLLECVDHDLEKTRVSVAEEDRKYQAEVQYLALLQKQIKQHEIQEEQMHTQRCHQCQISKNKEKTLTCTCCHRLFCADCLLKVYDMKVLGQCLRKCPLCKHQCHCSLCLAKSNYKKLSKLYPLPQESQIAVKCQVCSPYPLPRVPYQAYLELTPAISVSPVLQCCYCSVAVHVRCLSFVSLPLVQLQNYLRYWKCDGCRYAKLLPITKTKAVLECTICHQANDWKGLYLYQYLDKLQEWVHVACFQWQQSLAQVPLVPEVAVCHICTLSVGLKMQCSREACDVIFHPQCNSSFCHLVETEQGLCGIGFCTSHRPLTNDLAAYQQLQYLRQDFERVRAVLAMLPKREKQKKQLAQLEHQIYQQKLLKAASRRKRKLKPATLTTRGGCLKLPKKLKMTKPSLDVKRTS